MFIPCGIPYVIEGKVKRFEEIKQSVPRTPNLEFLRNHQALKINDKNLCLFVGV
jgi:hypothetical protein